MMTVFIFACLFLTAAVLGTEIIANHPSLRWFQLERQKAIDAAKKKDLQETNFYDICDQVAALGYPCTHVNVTTSDGFVLDVIRLPSSRASPYPVFLQHGLVDSAVTYVMNAHPHQNLACLLHDLGYDVWMNNARGNHYSMDNVKYSSSSDMYWYLLDMDGMASKDLPAVIDAALSATGSATLAYVGHSQGGMMGFAAFSTSQPSYANKVDLFVGLAPACYVSHTTSELIKLLGKLQPWEMELFIGNKTFLSADYATRQVAKLCPDLGNACVHSLNMVFGYGNESNINASQLQFLTRYDPGGTSVNNLIHWVQWLQSGKFQMHDFGPEINQEMYHESTAPLYNLSAMLGPPVALFFGGKDALVSPEDAAILTAAIPPQLIVAHETIPSYNHMELVWGLTAHEQVYPRIISLIEQHKGKRAGV
jgi:pimeloyl-ACP methyl ester carboxylesterase